MKNKHSLIPDWAVADLERQDAARAKARAEGPQTEASWRTMFAKKIGYELDLANRWNATADTNSYNDYEEVSRSIPSKYPPRLMGRFEKWLRRWKNRAGLPVLQFSPARNLPGFIFNEGGRGVTLSLMGKRLPFRLYIAGWVLTYRQGWSFKRR